MSSKSGPFFVLVSFNKMPPVNNVITRIPRLLLQAIAVTKWVEESLFCFLFNLIGCLMHLLGPLLTIGSASLNTFQVAKAFSAFYIFDKMEDN